MQAGDGPQRGGLAGAVRAEQGDHLAGPDVQVEVAHGDRCVVAGGEPFELEHRGGGGAHTGALQLAGRRPEIGGDHVRIEAHLGGRAGGDHLAELDHDDPVADAEHEAHVVVDEQGRRATVDDLAQLTTEHHRLVGVEAGGRLVEAQQLGAGGQRSGDGDELALALGQLARRGVGETAEVEHIERLVDRIGVGDRPGEHLLDRRPRRRVDGRHGEVLAHGEVVEQLDRLPGARHALPGAGVGAQAGDVGAVDGDRAEVRHEAGDRVDERRLAGPVRADQPDQLAGLDFEVDVDDGVHAPERHRDPAGGEERH